MRIRNKRSTAIAGSMPHDKRFAYTTTGTLLSVWEAAASSQHGDGFAMASRPRKTDIVYANGEAVIEIVTRVSPAQGDPHDDSLYMPIPPPPPENIYELHNDYLGSPRYITHGSKPPSLLPRGEMAGEQAFGPYGERMDGNFVVGGTPSNPILKDLPWGYKPKTGYTGHINEDMTGLIYMRGRYYSPAWHRFVSSDQGVDPLSINQFAYVGGMPFMAVDPSGMFLGWLWNSIGNMFSKIGSFFSSIFSAIGNFFSNIFSSGTSPGGWDDDPPDKGDPGEKGGRGDRNKDKPKEDPLCAMLRAMGMTGKDLAKIVEAFKVMNNGLLSKTATSARASEWGVSKDGGGEYRWGWTLQENEQKFRRGGIEFTINRNFIFNVSGFERAASPNTGSFFFHGHFDTFGVIPYKPSGPDRKLANDYPESVHLYGAPLGLFQFDGDSMHNKLAGSNWWRIKCP